MVNYLAGVKTLHRILDIDTQGFSGFLLKLTLRGLRRSNVHLSKHATPISPALLQKFRTKLNLDKEEDLIFWTLSLLAFFLLFRKSNLVPDKKLGFDEEKQLSWKRLRFVEDRVIVSVTWTKTHQFMQDELQFPLKELPGSVLCPVQALRKWKDKCKFTQNDDHCFSLSKGGSYTYHKFNKKLKQVAEDCGEDPTLFSCHGYRHGGCTWAFLSGVPTPLIRALGAWKSDCFLRYIHFPLEARTAACDLMRLRLKMAGY